MSGDGRENVWSEVGVTDPWRDFWQVPRALGYLLDTGTVNGREFAVVCWVGMSNGDRERPPAVTYSLLASKCGCSNKTIKRVLERLRDLRLVAYEEPLAGSHNNSFVLRLGACLLRPSSAPPRSPETHDVSQEDPPLAEDASRVKPAPAAASDVSAAEDVPRRVPLSLSEGVNDHNVSNGPRAPEVDEGTTGTRDQEGEVVVRRASDSDRLIAALPDVVTPGAVNFQIPARAAAELSHVLPGNDGFLDYLADAHARDLITITEALEREHLHRTLTAALPPASSLSSPNEADG